jgi:hypothetical protein
MNTFRYQAIEAGGTPVEGVIEAEDRKTALQLLGKRGLYPSSLEVSSLMGSASAPASGVSLARAAERHWGSRIKRLHPGNERPPGRGHPHPAGPGWPW